MEEIIEIPVTAEDIDSREDWMSGRVGARCMMDRALDRKFGDKVYNMIMSIAVRGEMAPVGTKTIRFDTETVEKRSAYDRGEPVEPFVAKGSFMVDDDPLYG